MSYFEDFEEIHLGDLYYEDDYLSRPIFAFENLNNKWKTKDGSILNLTDMKSTHIQNCINMIERRCRQYGLTATDYPIYKNLKKELENRNK